MATMLVKKGPQGLHARAFQAQHGWASVEIGVGAGAEPRTCQRLWLPWQEGVCVPYHMGRPSGWPPSTNWLDFAQIVAIPQNPMQNA